MAAKKLKATTQIVNLPISGDKALLAPSSMNTARYSSPLFVGKLVQLMLNEGWIATSIIRHREPFNIEECEQATTELQALRDSIENTPDKDFTESFKYNENGVKLTKALYLAEFDKQHKVVNGIVPAYNMTNCRFVVEGNQRRNAVIAANALLNERHAAITHVLSIELDFIEQARQNLNSEASADDISKEALRLSKIANILENRQKGEGTSPITPLDQYKSCLELWTGSIEGYQAICREALGDSAGQKVAAVKRLGIMKHVAIEAYYGRSLDAEILAADSRISFAGLSGVTAVALCNGKRRVGKEDIIVDNSNGAVIDFLKGANVGDKQFTGKDIMGLLQGSISPAMQALGKLFATDNADNRRKIVAILSMSELATLAIDDRVNEIVEGSNVVIEE